MKQENWHWEVMSLTFGRGRLFYTDGFSVSNFF